MRLFCSLDFSKGGNRAFRPILRGLYRRSLRFPDFSRKSSAWPSLSRESIGICCSSLARGSPKASELGSLRSPAPLREKYSTNIFLSSSQLRVFGLNSRSSLATNCRVLATEARSWPALDFLEKSGLQGIVAGPKAVRPPRPAGFRGSWPPLAGKCCAARRFSATRRREGVENIFRPKRLDFVKSILGPGNPDDREPRLSIIGLPAGPESLDSSSLLGSKNISAPRARLDTAENRRAAQHFPAKGGQDPLKSSDAEASCLRQYLTALEFLEF